MATGAGSSDADDARPAFVYGEAVRGLVQQQGQLESLHARAGTLSFATSFASSLLGGRALADGLGTWDWVAIALPPRLGQLPDSSISADHIPINGGRGGCAHPMN